MFMLMEKKSRMEHTLTKHDNKKSEIINATLRCLYEKGAEEISMRTIAKEAKVNQSTLHYYFQNKENLLINFIAALFDKFIYDIEKQYRHSDPDKKLDAIFLAGKTFVGRQKELFVILIHCWALSMRNRTMRKEFSDRYEKISGLIDDVLKEGYQKGIFNKITSDTFSNYIIAFVQGIGCQWYMTEKSFNLNKFFDLFTANIKQLIFKKIP
jgi:AcrR family transcriptional regulator